MNINFRVLRISLLILLLPSTGLTVTETWPLTLAEAERLAVVNEPGMLATQAEAESLADQAISSGALPDPQIRLGLANLPVNGFDFAQEPMTQKQIGFRQQLPPAGSRKARRRQLAQQAYAMDFALQSRKRVVINNVREVWLERSYWQQAKRIVTEKRQLFAQLIQIARSLYSVGRQNQQDLVRAELELSRLDNRLLTIEEQLHHSIAGLAQWLDKKVAYQPFIETIPAWNAPPPLIELQSKLAEHPQLQMGSAQMASAAANVDIARAQYKPAVVLDLTYGIREDDLLGNPRDDFLSIMVTLDVPLFTAKRQDKRVSSALRKYSVAENEHEMLLRKLNRHLETHYVHWQQLQFQLELFQQTILQQSSLQATAALQAYQNDTGDFAEVMRAYIAELNTRLEFMRLQTDQAKSLAKLDYLVPIISLQSAESQGVDDYDK